MAILDVFKKKKKIKELKKITKEKPPEIKTEKEPKSKSKIPEIAYRILKAPQITEKATALAKKNQYTFKVFERANKTEIKKAIENLYGVEVVSVKIIKVPPKKRRLGRISGWRKGYKKAIVKIKEGQKIEVLPR